MSSAFNGADLFGSGPHRFSQLAIGEYILSNARLDPTLAGSRPIGPLELIIQVRGRLVAGIESDLWDQRDLIAAQLTDPPTSATLKELSGRSWDDILFVAFTPADRTDRGQSVSIAYTATFVRFLIP